MRPSWLRPHRPDVLVLQEPTAYARAVNDAVRADYPYSYAAGLDTEHGGLAAPIDRAAALPAPVILAGDFNLAAGSRAYRGLPGDWHDAFAEAGRGFGHTYPVRDHEHEGEEPPGSPGRSRSCGSTAS